MMQLTCPGSYLGAIMLNAIKAVGLDWLLCLKII